MKIQKNIFSLSISIYIVLFTKGLLSAPINNEEDSMQEKPLLNVVSLETKKTLLEDTGLFDIIFMPNEYEQIQENMGRKLTTEHGQHTYTLFHPAKNYSPQVATQIGSLKRIAKFQHNVKDSTQVGDGLIKESQLFSKLILACSAYNGLTKTQKQFTLNSIRYYNNAPLDGSQDTINIRETIAGSNDYYLNDEKKSSVEDIKNIMDCLANLTPDLERQQILKRSALFVSIQIMAFDRPFSELDRAWSKTAAQILNISAKEESVLVALSLLDHQYTPLGPKPAVNQSEFEQVTPKLNAIENEFNAFYGSLSNVPSMR